MVVTCHAIFYYMWDDVGYPTKTEFGFFGLLIFWFWEETKSNQVEPSLHSSALVECKFQLYYLRYFPIFDQNLRKIIKNVEGNLGFFFDNTGSIFVQ